MEAVTDNRIKDDAKELAEKPSGDGGMDLGGTEGEGGTTTVSTGTAAASTETSKTDKDTMPETDPGQGQDGGLGGSGGGQSTTYVEFPRGDEYVPVYYINDGTATINYTTNDVVLKNIYWKTTGSDGNNIADAVYTSGEDDPELTKGFDKVTEDQLTLLLDATILKAYFDKTMEIQVDWESEDKKFTGYTRSLYFSVSNKSTNTTLEEEIRASASSEVSLEATTAATSTASASATDSASKSGGGGGGLSTGAKAGIAVGAVIGGLLIIGALAFFLLRRRRRSKQLGEDYTSQQAYTVDKETHGRATDSPNSPYSDENQVQPVALQNINHDHDEQTARGTPTPGGIPRTSTGSRNAPTPQGMSSNVAHLVEDGMTADEIRRLEEEERQLDDESERAARR
ncbi:hypothetical protein CEP51_012169 [Fusarium floridanum]|uniref:Mid2 domain-containing protein n=1 Tax=Fusarium floridanum TaxID=1325733 RepID=A0A428QZV7_9HYPO|nr:hypothetical protein CEP51_012169 [Fusarium floridanum]